MNKWFDCADAGKNNIIGSRVRLARNINEYCFPSKLTDEDSTIIIKRVENELKGLKEYDGMNYLNGMLSDIDELERLALRERKVFNKSIIEKKSPVGIMLSEDESTSVVINGDDHIRIQVLSSGLKLKYLLDRANGIDDYINDRFIYAYDKQYGYLTSYPTNVGTGMRASVILHLPTLSSGRKFLDLVADMGRFGTSIRSLYGEGTEKYGDLYEVSNQKTLGISEEEIAAMVSKVARQLDSQEQTVRAMAVKNHRLLREDEAYKSYGVLKFARRLTLKDSMMLLSQVMTGLTDGLLDMKTECRVFKLMLGVQPANLSKLSEKPVSKEELEILRAEYLRNELPELK